MIALAAWHVANAAAHFRRWAAVGRPTCQLQLQCRARPLAASHAWLPSPAIPSLPLAGGAEWGPASSILSTPGAILALSHFDRRHEGTAQMCCSPTRSRRHNTPRRRATSGGVRCCNGSWPSPVLSTTVPPNRSVICAVISSRKHGVVDKLNDRIREGEIERR